MSKQSKTADRAVSRLRRPMNRLRDLPIWSKLVLIMIVPTIAAILVGANSVADRVATAGNAERARRLASVVEASGGLVDALQNERASAILLLGYADRNDAQRYRDNYAMTGKSVDAAVKPYAQRRAQLDDLPANVAQLLAEIDRNLADLPAVRSQVANTQIRLSEATQLYDVLINDLLDMRDSAMQLTADFGLSQRMRAATAISRAKEHLSQKRIVVHRAFIQDQLTPVLRNEFIAADQGQAQAMQTFNAVATAAEAELHSQTVAGPDLREAEAYITWVKTNADAGIRAADFTSDDWDAALVANARLIRSVESNLDGRVVKQATQLRNDVLRSLFIETGLLLVMLLLAVLFTWMVARSMARSLRELREGALSVAQFGLPQAVARLRDPQTIAHLSPEEVANQIAEPLPVRSRDEFGQVAEAFNVVHLEAVRTAAEQAALRASVATMFVNLARRSQILVDRLIGHLDRLERGEEDPDRLAELFKLDHLATRMRRNDENLLVLAGADSTRVQREPAALIDVLRAAQSEVEHYTRIEFGAIDRELEIVAQAVNDMVHLVAELLDNATAFSPPDTQVVVEARRHGDRAVIYIEDRGIGITPEQLAELNQRLAKPPAVDVTVSRMMGLVVVARLAARHGVKVELRPGEERGTVAQVTLPASVLAPRALAGRPQSEAANGTEAPSAPVGVPLPSDRFMSAPPAGQGVMAGLAGRPTDPSPEAAPVSRATGPMPPWSDLTGATVTTNDALPFTPRRSDSHTADPLPQRRPAERPTVDGEVTTTLSIPRQVAGSPEARQAAGAAPAAPSSPAVPPASTPHDATSPAVAPPQPTPPAVEPPPAWPPVPAEPTSQSSDAPARPVAAGDVAAEVPRVSRPSTDIPTPRPAETPSRYVDETMELPIFREVESAWFRTRRVVPEGVATATGPTSARPSDQAATTAGGSGGSGGRNDTSMPSDRGVPVGAAGETSMVGAPMSVTGSSGVEANNGTSDGIGGGTFSSVSSAHTDGWRTAADEGWRAASAAAQVPVRETTRTGLPKRVPMAQLVPGGIDKPADSMQRRTPEGVRGLLSAYHRGVQRGRANSRDERSGSSSARQQFSQPGADAAGRGQKEHQG